MVSVTSESQFISSSSALSDGGGAVQSALSTCGSKSHPWRLEAPLGQRINISLLDFTPMTSGDQHHDSDVTQCRQYGYIVDKAGKKNVSICTSVSDDRYRSDERHMHVYTSHSNSIDIVLTSGATIGSDAYNFLIKINGLYIGY